jgi:hypothetical protein
MSYRAKTRGLANIGVPDGDNRIVCDGCGKERSALKPHGFRYAWLINIHKVPGWFKIIKHEFTRSDYCTEKCYQDRKATP